MFAHFVFSGRQFDVNSAILNSLKNLEVTLDIDSALKIDDCEYILLRRRLYSSCNANM